MSFRWTSRSRRANRAGTALATLSSRKQAGQHRMLYQALEVLEDRTLLNAGPSSSPTYVVYNSGVGPDQSTSPQGFDPAQIRTAYGFDQVSIGGVAGNGAGQTIAIVDAFNQPDIVSDLHNFDQQFGLPDPPNFTVVNQNGQTSPLPMNAPAGTWGTEISLDVEWAHSMAPAANIIQVEANSAFDSDLIQTAVPTAADLPGVSVVSMSFGGPEFLGENSLDSVFTTPAGHTPVTFLASTGDSAAPGGYPAFSPNVVAVGGTSLFVNGDNSYNHETAWNLTGSGATQQGGGGGVSTQEQVPSYQSSLGLGFTGRSTPDISFDANPATGVAVYDSYDNGASTPWEQVGGTSLACPAWAGLMSIVNEARVAAGDGLLDGPSQTLPLLYSLPASAFHDITVGNNGFPAGPGYDLATGIGSPIAPQIVTDLAPLKVTVTAQPIVGAVEGLPLVAVELATFTDSTALFAASSYTALISWGDGTSTSLGIVNDLGGGTFSVTGSHTYNEEGSYTLTVSVINPTGASGQGSRHHDRVRRPAPAGYLCDADLASAGGRPAVDGRGRYVHRYRRRRPRIGLHGAHQLGRQRDEPGNAHSHRQR